MKRWIHTSGRPSGLADGVFVPVAANLRVRVTVRNAPVTLPVQTERPGDASQAFVKMRSVLNESILQIMLSAPEGLSSLRLRRAVSFPPNAA